MEKIKILIADDQILMREGLRTILGLEEDITVVGVVGNGREAFDKAREYFPDIILMDIRMPIMNGVEATKLIHQHLPGIKIIILTTFDDDEYIFDALKSGASGYLLKDLPSEELIGAIRKVYRGGVLMPPEIMAKVVAEFARMGDIRQEDHHRVPMGEMIGKREIVEQLTSREIEIIRLISAGKSNKEIAGTLYITEGTVKNHISNILGKMDLRDRTQIVIYAIQNRLL